MHRLPIFQDSRSFDERTDRLLTEVRRQIDEDLQSFGFGSKNLLGSSRLNWPAEEEENPASKLLNRDFFKLRPTASTSASSILGQGASSSSSDRLSSPPPRKDDLAGSRETLDEETAKGLYVDRPQSGEGRLFCMSFDVKDFEAEDISVTVEDDTLIVQAKRRTEKEGAVSVKEFNRKIKLPKDVDPEKLVSTMTSDGILTIEAQVPPDYQSAVATPPPTPGGGPDLNGSSAGNGGAGASAGAAAAPTSSTPIPLDTPVFSVEGSTGRRRLDLVLEVGSPYTPEDITVKLEGKRLIVEATHEEKWQGRTSKVSMQRDFDLSEDIDVSSVKALLKGSGQLTITAYAK